VSFVSDPCPARYWHTSNNVPTDTSAAEPLLEVAGIEQAEARMQKSTSALFMRSGQVKHDYRHPPQLTVNDRNFVSCRRSSVFFVSREAVKLPTSSSDATLAALSMWSRRGLRTNAQCHHRWFLE
jgi:hypothetical protein